MIAATGWLQSLLAAPESADVPRRVQVLEEIWALLGSERVAKYYQSCQKLARSYGVANMSVAHRIADLRSQADDGTATAKVAMGILADTQTQILFRQPTDQIAEATQILGLTSHEAEHPPASRPGRSPVERRRPRRRRPPPHRTDGVAHLRDQPKGDDMNPLPNDFRLVRFGTGCLRGTSTRATRATSSPRASTSTQSSWRTC